MLIHLTCEDTMKKIMEIFNRISQYFFIPNDFNSFSYYYSKQKTTYDKAIDNHYTKSTKHIQYELLFVSAEMKMEIWLKL